MAKHEPPNLGRTKLVAWEAQHNQPLAAVPVIELAQLLVLWCKAALHNTSAVDMQRSATLTALCCVKAMAGGSDT